MSQKFAGPEITISSPLGLLVQLMLSFIFILSLSPCPLLFLALTHNNVTFPDSGSSSMLGQVPAALLSLKDPSPQPCPFHLHKKWKLRLREACLLIRGHTAWSGRAIVAQTTVHCLIQGFPSHWGWLEENRHFKHHRDNASWGHQPPQP